MSARDVDRKLAEAMWGGFYYCPTTGRIIEALPGDDKAICSCRRSNPTVPSERTEQTWTHVVRFLTHATTDAYLDQCAQDESDARDHAR